MYYLIIKSQSVLVVLVSMIISAMDSLTVFWKVVNGLFSLFGQDSTDKTATESVVALYILCVTLSGKESWIYCLITSVSILTIAWRPESVSELVDSLPCQGWNDELSFRLHHVTQHDLVQHHLMQQESSGSYGAVSDWVKYLSLWLTSSFVCHN